MSCCKSRSLDPRGLRWGLPAAVITGLALALLLAAA
jgi:hypothetical protein